MHFHSTVFPRRDPSLNSGESRENEYVHGATCSVVNETDTHILSFTLCFILLYCTHAVWVLCNLVQYCDVMYIHALTFSSAVKTVPLLRNPSVISVLFVILVHPFLTVPSRAAVSFCIFVFFFVC